MELRSFIQIFIDEKRLIATLFLVVFLIALFAYRLQTQWYTSTVLISVTRTSVEDTPDYRYDSLYRLQADERIADTVARYLESGTGVEAIARRAGIDAVSQEFFIDGEPRALRTSSQIVQFDYRARTPNEAKRLGEASLEVAERYVVSLNEQARERNWFTLLGTEPFVEDGRFSLFRTLGLALIGAGLIAFWTVLIRWYWTRSAPPLR